MSNYELITTEVPEPPGKARRSTRGRYEQVLQAARDAGGEWIALKSLPNEDETEAKAGQRVSSVASRINLGKLKGTVKGQFEARSSTKDAMIWIRHVTDDVVEEESVVEDVVPAEPAPAVDPAPSEPADAAPPSAPNPAPGDQEPAVEQPAGAAATPAEPVPQTAGAPRKKPAAAPAADGGLGSLLDQ